MALILLPTEIWLLILGHCAPQPVATGSTRPDTLEHRKQRATLCNVCFACRRLRDIATPLLYRHLAATNSAEAVSLFCTLVTNRCLRRYPRSFTSLLCLGERDDCSQTRKLWIQKFVLEIRAMHLDIEAQRALTRSGIACGCIPDLFDTNVECLPQQLIAVILLLCKGLEDIMIQAPNTGESMWSEHKDLSFIRDALVGNAYLMSSKALDYQVPDTDMDVLPSLRTWRIQIDPDALHLEIEWNARYTLNPIFIPQLLRPRSKLAKIEIYGDDGDYLPGLSDTRSDDLSFLREMECVRLLWSLAGPATVERLLRHCNTLNHLTWTFSQVKWVDYDEDSDEFTLDSALSPTRKTLQSLHVESSMTNDNYAMPHDFFLSLNTLREFPSLEQLRVDTVTLFGLKPHHRLNGPNQVSLESRLPPNLISLQIIEQAVEWYAVEQYEKWMQTLLTRFAVTCKNHQPSLRHFAFEAFKPSTGVTAEKQVFRGRQSIERLGALFADAGVRFVWQ